MKTERTRGLPPFFTQVIGSLPRPKLVTDLHLGRDEIPQERFSQIIDEVVIFAIRLQELAGLDVVSDGEWRRIHYVDEFLARIGGFEKIRPFEHAGEKKFHFVVTEKICPGNSVFLRDAEFLLDHSSRVTKFALPSPFLIGIRYWHEDFSADAYPTVEEFMEDLANVLAGEAHALADVGIDIIQIDDPALTYFCDRELMNKGDTHDDRLRRDWYPDKQIGYAVSLLNRIVDGVKAETHLHCCHSVYKRSSDVTGNYEPLLPQLRDIHVDRINLEFAYQGTGAISDLNLLPNGIDVGMGVIDVRSERVQDIEEVVSLGREGAKILDPSHIALNPDCGFAPDMGEPPTIDEAYEKLCVLTEAARRLREEL